MQVRPLPSTPHHHPLSRVRLTPILQKIHPPRQTPTQLPPLHNRPPRPPHLLRRRRDPRLAPRQDHHLDPLRPRLVAPASSRFQTRRLPRHRSGRTHPPHPHRPNPPQTRIRPRRQSPRLPGRPIPPLGPRLGRHCPGHLPVPP